MFALPPATLRVDGILFGGLRVIGRRSVTVCCSGHRVVVGSVLSCKHFHVRVRGSWSFEAAIKPNTKPTLASRHQTPSHSVSSGMLWNSLEDASLEISEHPVRLDREMRHTKPPLLDQLKWLSLDI